VNPKSYESEQKLRGGYYTPDDLADFLVRWIAAEQPRSVLEPSCGDGVFLDRIASHLSASTVTGFEIDHGEAQKAAQRGETLALADVDIHSSDFLGWAVSALNDGAPHFDAVVGNPPFVRYQFLPHLFQERSQAIFDTLGCRFTKHTNAWVPFVMASLALLRPGGRLAMVVPAEIIHVMHARSLREYLGQQARRIVIIDPEELWFPGTLQGTVLLLAEKRRDKNERPEGVGIYRVRGREFLALDPNAIFDTPDLINGKTIEGKWTPALLDSKTRSLMGQLASTDSVRRFDEVATVDVGIVTGANKFFLVNDDTIRRYGLEKWAHPMFGRSEHCPGVIYDRAQHRANTEEGRPTNFVWFRDDKVERSATASEYIRNGESEDLHERYKCRIRTPWYAVPSVYATEVGMLKRAHSTPRLILNTMMAYTTDTSYRIQVKEGTAAHLVSNFLNPLTALSAELEGRHYGGGVLELVPSEIERLLIPHSAEVEVDVMALDDAVRSSPIDIVLEHQAKVVLGPLGVAMSDQDRLLDSWRKLRDRRRRVSSADT
jgi:adenine-specific DNA methylase